MTWGDVFWRHVQAGEDRSGAAYRADEWEKRQARPAPEERAPMARPRQPDEEAT